MKTLAAKLAHHTHLAKGHYDNAAKLVPENSHEEMSALRGFHKHAHVSNAGLSPDHAKKIERHAGHVIFSRFHKIQDKHNPSGGASMEDRLGRYHDMGRAHLKLGDFHARHAERLKQEYARHASKELDNLAHHGNP